MISSVEVAQKTPTYCGYVTIVGRPNVGKSTLLNKIIGQKISITSRKAQTTRHHMFGINTEENYQTIYIDTPGVYSAPNNALGKYMDRQIKSALRGVDGLIYMVEALKWNMLDRQVLKLINQRPIPIILVINKVDKVKDKTLILPYIKELSKKISCKDIILTSALSKKSLKPLEDCIKKILPINAFQYPNTQMTNMPQRYFVAEFIREKLIRRLGKELPYTLTVTSESFIDKGHIIHINALIWVASKSQKKIVIGNKGIVLKTIGEQARKEMEYMFNNKVFLTLWVKVQEQWMNNECSMKKLEFNL